MPPVGNLVLIIASTCKLTPSTFPKTWKLLTRYCSANHLIHTCYWRTKYSLEPPSHGFVFLQNFLKRKRDCTCRGKTNPTLMQQYLGFFFSLIMCCHGKMNCPNDIQASKMQNQPHVSSQLCQFCFQYLSLNPVIEILEIPGQAGCRRHRHNCDYIFMIMSDEPFAECL